MKNWSYLSYLRIFISKESMSHARSTSNIKFRSFISFYKAILGPSKSCFDQLDQEFLKSWSYLSYPRIFISREMLFREKTMFKIYLMYKSIISFLMFWQARSRFFETLIRSVLSTYYYLKSKKQCLRWSFLYKPILSL